MRYKDDWNETREWLTKWWDREVGDHWALGVFAPRETPLPVETDAPPAPEDDRERWLDAEGNMLRLEHEWAKTFYGGIAFPYITASLGPGNLEVYLGSEPRFMPGTVWYEKAFDDPADVDLKWNPENPYWKWTMESTRLFQERVGDAGKALVAVPDLIEGIDVLSELLGTEELLMHLLDCPDEIHRLLGQLDDLYWNAFDPVYDIVRDDRDGNAFIAFNIWGPGKTLKSQCDFAAMIGPDMFAEFICPYLEKQCARADFSIFHLDGPSCIPHLEHLLNVPSLDAVQWTPGYPNPWAAHESWWDPIWRPVYDAGKCAVVMGNPADSVEPFVKEFGQKGTMFCCGTETEAEARKLLDDSTTWGA